MADTVPFQTTAANLGKLIEQARERGDIDTARALAEVLSNRRVQARYAEMAQQDPEAEGW